MHWNRKSFFSRTRRVWQIKGQSERWQSVDRNRVIDAISYSALSHLCAKCISIMANNSDRVLVVDVNRTRCNVGNNHSLEILIKELRICLSLLRPFCKLSKLHTPNGGVDVCHTGIESNNLVLVPLFHALVAEQSRLPGNFIIGRCDHSAFARCHVLGWVEREDARNTKCPNRGSIQRCHVRLGRIFDDQQIMAFGNIHNLFHCCRLTI